MTIPQQIAKHFRDVHFGGNWTYVNLQDTLKDISWQQAIEKIQSFNTIATLHFHINYYVTAITGVLEGSPPGGKRCIQLQSSPDQCGGGLGEANRTGKKSCAKTCRIDRSITREPVAGDFCP